MKTTYSALAVAAISMTFIAAGSGAAQDRIPDLQRDTAPAAKGAILTGCVTRGTEPGTYTLTNVTKAGDAAAKDAERPVTVLLASTDVEIGKHVDHMVAVTGSQALEERAVGTTGEKPAAPDSRKEDDKKTTPTFTVTSLKMVAESCAKPAL